MKKHTGVVILAVLVVAALLVSTVAYKVEFTEYALIKRFGATNRVIVPAEAGLKFKWPWPVEKLIRYDARTFLFEDTSNEVATRDKQNILLTLYCAWRIDDVRRFQSSIETVKASQEALRALLQSAKSDVVGLHNMEDFVNTDPGKMIIPEIERKILESVHERAMTDYGAEVVRVGIKSLALPETVSATVIDAMKEERQLDIRMFESAGEAQATAIRERAEAARDQIIAFAERKAAEIRAEGDRAAAKYYKEFAKNEQLSMFLRSLESLKKELASKATIILDGSEIPAVKFFHEGPSVKNLSGKSAAADK
ncbi:MAG: SPFH domain-containing protein [Planctomycetota bacterium]|nr:SPFH domain-containing protein [Planctomycetota bacterium]